jgi:hypothetical protein
MTRDEIAQHALSLPSDDRVFLPKLLEQSLTDCDLSPDELSAAWTEEIDRRIDDHQRSKNSFIDGNRALAEMEQNLAQHRAGKQI